MFNDDPNEASPVAAGSSSLKPKKGCNRALKEDRKMVFLCLISLSKIISASDFLLVRVFEHLDYRIILIVSTTCTFELLFIFSVLICSDCHQIEGKIQWSTYM